MCMCVNFFLQNIIKKVMSEELIYFVNDKKSNGNKRKNLWENEKIGLQKKWLKQEHRIDDAVLRSILSYIVTEHYHPNA